MTGKRFAKLSIALTLILLILVGVLQVAIDPLFQYHQPWFGMEPVITDERYQNAGVAKTFDYENVILGNSLSQNFIVSDVEKVFGGNTVKLTASGSHTVDWRYTLDILKHKAPKNILINLDPFVLNANPYELKHELPDYLYDNNYLNDVNYLFNFSILNKYSYQAIKKNLASKIPDYNKAFVWNDEIKTSREEALKHYRRPEKGAENISVDNLKTTAIANMDNLKEYYQALPDTQFVFFCSPFSILYWDSVNQKNGLKAWRDTYLTIIGDLVKYKNVSVFFWNDTEMRETICNLDYYSDDAHYNFDVCEMICDRISRKDGLLNQENYQESTNSFFDYLDSYNYDAIFN